MAQPKVTIHGLFVAGGEPMQGSVTFSDLSFSIDAVEAVVHPPLVETVYLDQNGEFYIDLPLNVGVSTFPAPRSYHAEMSIEGYSYGFDFTLDPISLEVEFTELMPVSEPPELPPAFVRSFLGMSGDITYEEFAAAAPALAPAAGKNAYQLWLDLGNSGSVSTFLEAFRGYVGLQGDKGEQGDQGEQGPVGPRGSVGPQGKAFHLTAVLDNSSVLVPGGLSNIDGSVSVVPVDSIVATLNNKHFYYWNGYSWIDLGSYQGAQGPAGPTATKASIGLGNVDNTSDANKPISTATQQALTQLALNVGQVTSVNGQTGAVLIGKTDVGLGNVPNTTAALWPHSTQLVADLASLTNALSGKLTTPAGGTNTKFLRGDLTWQTASAALVGLDQVKNFPSMADIPNGADLNTYLSNGTYSQYVAPASGTYVSQNFPVARSGFLEVMVSNSTPALVVQRYSTWATGEVQVFARSLYTGGAWSPWRRMLTDSTSETLVAASLKVVAGAGITAGGAVQGKSLVAGLFTDSFVDSGSTDLPYPPPPSATALPSAFPQGMSMYRLLSGNSQSPTNYPGLDGTVVMNRNTGYPRQDYYPLVGPAYTRAYNNGWGAWKPIQQEMQAGLLTITPVANDNVTVYVPFASGRFSVVPNVLVTPQTTFANRVSTSCSGITQSGFSLTLYRTTAADTTVNWFAVAGDF